MTEFLMKILVLMVLILYNVVLTVSQFNKNGGDAVTSIETLIQTGKIPFPPPHAPLPQNSSFITLLSGLCTVQNVDCLKNVEWIVSVRKRAAQKACEVYLQLPIDRILGGTPTADFPWMAALGYLNRELKVTFDCGGTVISELYVMTAAHCALAARPPVVVRLGKPTLTDAEDDIKATNHPIRDVIRHPNYSTLSKRNDIALLRLGKRIFFTPDITPPCLQMDLSDMNSNVKLLVTGWGVTVVERGVRSDVLLKTQLTTMTFSECERILSNFNLQANQAALQDGISQGQYCAYDPTGRNDSCQGDSGGPLQYFPTTSSSVSTVIGIVSYGFSCGTQLPGINTRVAFYLAKHDDKARLLASATK
ncbi:serine protease persephone-like [Contarinia nasturtii]|uniref:serine protease persephone-like n=1 Tax=Contarinia nasturtii TaxID=265458 RepID=UPI0012D48F77|nr:serine protease persephone-like [Contarinia nasturtii]